MMLYLAVILVTCLTTTIIGMYKPLLFRRTSIA